MKFKQKLLACLLALSVMMTGLGVTPALAAGTAYTYKVTLSMGRQGSYAGSGIQVQQAGNTPYQLSEADGKVTITGLQSGARISFQNEVSSVADAGKYYVRGVRISGRDNDSVDASSFSVTADTDYVVAYGILGDMTQYTVNYRDTDGNTLAPSKTYYGNVGDRPVIAYLYIDGWQPTSYNLTKTLVKNETENIFTFVYARVPSDDNGGGGGGGGGDDDTPTGATPTPDPAGGGGAGVPTPTATPPGEIIIYVTPTPGPTRPPVPGGTGTGTDDDNGGGGDDGDGEPTPTPDGEGENGDGTGDGTPDEIVVEVPAPSDGGAGANGANGAGGAGGAGDGTGDGTGLGTPEEITDIDANQTPLANLVKNIVEAVSNATPVQKVSGGVVGAGLLGLLLLLLLKRKKKKEDEEEQPDEAGTTEDTKNDEETQK